MLKGQPLSYTEILNELGIENGLLNYHLDNLRELLTKGEDEKYRLSEFGEAGLSVIDRVEIPRISYLKQGSWVIDRRIGAFILVIIVILSSFGIMVQRNRFIELKNRYDELEYDYWYKTAQYEYLQTSYNELNNQTANYREQIIELGQEVDRLEHYENTWRVYKNRFDEALIENGRVIGLLINQGYIENISTPTVESRKEVYPIGDTVTFKIQSDIPLYGSYFIIRDPDGALVWEGDVLIGWIEISNYWTVPYIHQTAYFEPMILIEDYQLGDWTWTYKFGDMVEINGTFRVIKPVT